MAVRRALTAIAVLFLFSCGQDRWPVADHTETEPNGDPQSATPIEEGLIYEGTIDDRRAGEGDSDYFSLTVRAGFIYRIDWESRDPDLFPAVQFSDNYGTVKDIAFAPSVRGTAEFFQVFDGRLLIAVRQGGGKPVIPQKWRDGRYWIRVSKEWACLRPVEALLTDKKEMTLDLAEPPGRSVLVSVAPDDGYYGISLTSERNEQEKKMILFECLTGTVIAGSEGIDRPGGLADPYLYEFFGGQHDRRLVVERWREEDGPVADRATLRLHRHDPATEMEPNDLHWYANVFDPAGTSGALDGAQKLIEGSWRADRDFFRVETIRGALATFDMEWLDPGEATVSLWSTSYDTGGYLLFPLRRIDLTGDGGTRHRLTTFLPFTGMLYFSLQGSDLSYRFTLVGDDDMPVHPGLGGVTVAGSPCAGVYFRWPFPPFSGAVRMTAESDGTPVAILLFDQRGLPFLELPPGDPTALYLTRLTENEEFTIGVVAQECPDTEYPTVTLRVEEAPFETDLPDFTDGETAVARPGVTSIGWMDSSRYLVENRWEFTPERDGTLLLMTAPLTAGGGHYIDTVIRLYEEGTDAPVAMNDDMIEMLNFNNYSFVRHPVVAGRRYEISVKPFMDASSHIPSMNIRGHYALDVRFE